MQTANASRISGEHMIENIRRCCNQKEYSVVAARGDCAVASEGRGEFEWYSGGDGRAVEAEWWKWRGVLCRPHCTMGE